MALTYYVPYVSGLTETARVIAEGLAARGWRNRGSLPNGLFSTAALIWPRPKPWRT